MDAQELVLDPLPGGSAGDYRGRWRLSRVARPIGRNQCGVIAWMVRPVSRL